MSDAERDREQRRVEAVLEEVSRQLSSREADAEKYRSLLSGTQAHIREETPRAVYSFDDLVEVAGGMAKLKEAGKMYRFSKDRAAQLRRLLKSPYFARVDFRESGKPDAQPIYIGISSLTDARSGEHLIYDWRAPVSGIYYDYELGPAEYEAPRGKVTGEMLLKRHFRIRDGRLDLMFDNSLTIYDEMLQETLGSATGDRMRSIVNTIQREQNRVIRAENRGALVVQGAAGSGKTVIALHRAAYLLYKHRETMSAESILVFTPGRLFVDYASPVLPELGERPVMQTSFSDFAAERLRLLFEDGVQITIERQADQLERLLDGAVLHGREARKAGIRLKSSQAFAELLVRYAERIAHEAKGPGQITFRGRGVMSREEGERLLRRDYAYLPLKKRVDKIRRRIDWLLEEIQEKRAAEIQKEIAESPDSAYLFAREIRRMSRSRARAEVQAVRERMLAWRPVSAMQAYMRLFEDEELFFSLADGFETAGGRGVEAARTRATPADREARVRSGTAETEGPGQDEAPDARRRHDFRRISTQTLESLRSGRILYEDLAPIILLQGLLQGFTEPGDIKHVIVDEAQDFAPVQHEVLRRVFTDASFTILGDVNQSMNPAASASYEEIVRQAARTYGSSGPVIPVRLTESYRSTREITEFTKAILDGGEPVEAVERPGELPVVCPSRSRAELATSIAVDIASLVREGIGSIAIICKTARESWAAHDDLSRQGTLKDVDVRLIGPEESRFRRGVAVIPSYLAKGLEFEAVVIYDAGRERYNAPGDRRVLYTACTRALHRLHVHYTGELSPFIAGMDRRLYEARPGPD